MTTHPAQADEAKGMTDRELLEAAAEASCIVLHVWGAKGNENFADMTDGGNHKLWNPLTDDGDALRLAVKLRLNITFTHELGRGFRNEFMQVSPRSMGHLAEFGPLGADPSETIRRAIVRAAAALHPDGGNPR